MSQFFWAQPPCDAIYYQLCTGLNPYTIRGDRVASPYHQVGAYLEAIDEGVLMART